MFTSPGLRTLSVFKLMKYNLNSSYLVPKYFAEQNILVCNKKNNHIKYFSSNSSIQEPSKIPISPLSSLFPKQADTQKVQDDQQPPNEEDAQKAREASWRTMKYTLAAFGISFTIFGGWLIVEFGAPKLDEDKNPIRDEYSSLPIVQQYFYRMLNEMEYYKKMIKEPSREKLLPDPLTYPYYQPPYTLVLELTDLLVHPDWTYKTGWRFKKRPGIDHFLQQVGPPLFEVVIYTAEAGMTVFPIIEALDPNQVITYKLVRDATLFEDGHHIKDLNKLNRDLSKVIVVDWNQDSTKYHPENTLKISRWNGNDDDTALIDLAAFLKTVATSGVDDVRDVLTYYRNFDNPLITFRENQRKLIEQQEAQREAEAAQPASLTKTWTPNFLHRR